MKAKTGIGRIFIIVVKVLILSLSMGCSSPNPFPPEKTSPHHLTPLPLGKVTAGGWLKIQLERNKAGMGGHLDELEPDMIAKPYVTREFKSKVSPGWSGEISGTYWTGLVQLAFTLNDEELKAKARKWVYSTIALQEEDGYLGSYLKTDNRLEDYCPWSANWCYRALLHWYDATGDQAVLDAVHRGLLWFVENWSDEQKTNYVGPTLIESMIVVYLETGDEKLFNWSIDYMKWLDKNDQFHHGMASLQRQSLDYNDDHVVAFGENLKHPALIYLAGGEQQYLDATLQGIKQIIDKCWQPTGAPSSNIEYLSPPSAIHVTEYCNFSTFLNTFSWMASITGEARYGDLMERILFNAAQGAKKKDERAIAYMSSPNQMNADMESCRFGASSMEAYAPCYHTACCPAQSVRIIPEYIRAMFMHDKDENLYLPAFGPCTVNFTSREGTRITILEDTNYPFEETITLHIKADSPWEKYLMLKIPSWCNKFEIKLNGVAVKGSVNSAGYMPVKNTWNNDSLTILFDMKPSIVPVNDVYFQKEPLHSVECGPLLFALKYPEVWTPVTGTPLSPLPPDWSWYAASYGPMNKPSEPVFYSFNLDEVKRENAIIKKRSVSSYPWDDSPLKLAVPMHRTKQAYPNFWKNQKITSLMPYDNPVTADSVTEIVELVPYGSTNLRMSCFSVCK